MKYTVLVTQDITESALIEVEAESKEDAADTALLKASSEAVGWEVNDINSLSPYLGDSIENDVTQLDD